MYVRVCDSLTLSAIVSPTAAEAAATRPTNWKPYPYIHKYMHTYIHTYSHLNGYGLWTLHVDPRESRGDGRENAYASHEIPARGRLLVGQLSDGRDGRSGRPNTHHLYKKFFFNEMYVCMY